MTKLQHRIIDLLVDDREVLEELFIGVNFRREDNTYYRYREHYRLTEIIDAINSLVEGCIITRIANQQAVKASSIAEEQYELTESGLQIWENDIASLQQLYEIA